MPTRWLGAWPRLTSPKSPFSSASTNSTRSQATAAATWNDAHPAGLQPPVERDQSGAARRPARAPPSAISSPRHSGWTNEEKAAWQGGLALWSAVANITFTEAAERQRRELQDRARHRQRGACDRGTARQPARSATARPDADATGSVVSIDTTADELRPDRREHSRRRAAIRCRRWSTRSATSSASATAGLYNGDVNPTVSSSSVAYDTDAVDTDVVHQAR